MKTGGLREKVYQAAEKWDLWGYGSFGLPRIEMEGDRRVLIEEHGGILEYGPDCIRVAARGLVICIRGRDLEIASMEPGSLALRGCIRDVGLEAREEEGRG
ncbi:MAG: YabP/YqfC family sporulation protein [Clostridia bacterium]|nr:YabP/YqfC family sporulation protein [Clostridia bacterium]